jgi:hypothetical protein
MKIAIARLTLVLVCLTLVCVLTVASHAEFVVVLTADEGTGDMAADISGNDNDAELIGVGWGTGKFGGALSFDGVDDFVKIPMSNSLLITDAITLVAWIKTGEIPADQQVLMGRWKWTGVNERSFFLGHGPYPWVPEPRLLKMLLSPNGADPPTIAASDGELPVDEWTHVAGVWDGNDMRVYVNGDLAGTPVAFAGPIHAGAAFLELGTQDEGGTSFILGFMDEVGVANHASSPAEIQQIMNQGFEGAGSVSVSPSGKLAITWGHVKAQQ